MLALYPITRFPVYAPNHFDGDVTFMGLLAGFGLLGAIVGFFFLLGWLAER
jgi:hypothetical protein